MSEPLTDRELDAWIAEHVMGWPSMDKGTHTVWVRHNGSVTNQLGLKFCSDLNACAQAEAKIAEMRPHVMVEYALAITSEISGSAGPVHFQMVTRTARQRCEAMYAIREDIEKAHRPTPPKTPTSADRVRPRLLREDLPPPKLDMEK